MSSLPYRGRVQRELAVPKRPRGPLAVELYAGAGGSGLGFAAAGFRTIGYDADADACETYQTNLDSDCHQVVLTDSVELLPAPVLLAGPPCQPFSVTGRKCGATDVRDGMPVVLSAIRRHRPTVAVIENVPALTTEHRDYFESVLTDLRVNYEVAWAVLNAADFGVPQNRRRLFIVAHPGGFTFDSLKRCRTAVTVRDALGSMVRRIPRNAHLVTPAMDAYIARYERECQCREPRDLDPDSPARTLTCRNIGGTTSDMIRLRLPDGRRRRLTLREAARLQGFPDWYRFHGSKVSRFRQIGNAVPPLLAKAVAVAVRSFLRALDGTEGQ